MKNVTRRLALSLGLLAAGALALGAEVALAQAPKEIRIDFATYNPVSLVLKEQRPSGEGAGRRTASRSAGCSRLAPTRRWNS